MNSATAPAHVEMTASEEEILKSLRRIIRAVALYNRRLVAETGLSGPQLVCLRELDRQGALQPSQLSQRVNLSAATVCGILDRLEAHGLVFRERQTDDKRRVLVSLSEDGLRKVRRAPPALQDGFLFKLRALPLRRQAAIERTLKELVALMAANDLDAAPMLFAGESMSPGSATSPLDEPSPG